MKAAQAITEVDPLHGSALSAVIHPERAIQSGVCQVDDAVRQSVSVHVCM